MKPQRIIHLFGWDKKFFFPFRQLIQENFKYDQHTFIVYGDVKLNELSPSSGTLIYPSLLRNSFHFSKLMLEADKIIIHGLFNNHLLYLFTIQPWLLKKCYWVVWGGDLYIDPKKKNWRLIKNELFRKFVIPRIGFYVTGNIYDYHLILKRYGGHSPRIDCICYPTNIFDWSASHPLKGHKKTILVGNSADPTNNHFEIFSVLNKYRDLNIQIICPLSYGNREYAEKVIKKGEELFGNNFIPLKKFIHYSEYLTLLEKVDVAIFGHYRQQAFGNKIQLLGMGKKVFLRRESSLWQYFEDNKIKVFDLAHFNLEDIDKTTKMKNQDIIASKFSKNGLLKSLQKMFNSDSRKF